MSVSVPDECRTPPDRGSYAYNSGNSPCICFPSPAFRLLSVSSGTYEIKNDPVAIILVTEGAVRFSSKGESLLLEKGEAAIIPSGLEYTMTVRGNAYISEVPDA